jgi:RNA polymerase sigma-70 factor (ECF subfamily)
MASAEEHELIERAQQGDVDAFCLLVSQHQRRLYAQAFRFSRNHHDAEDLTQDVFMNAYRAIHRFKGDSLFQTWLRKIMLNTFLSHKRKKRPGSVKDITEYPTASSDPRTFENVLVRQIFQRLESIPARQRLMFLLKHQDGMTCEEIADHFGTSVGNVKKTLFRIIERLRQEFNGADEVKKEKQCTIVTNSVKI